MRPKPLIPTLVLAISKPLSAWRSNSSLTARVREKSVAIRSLREGRRADREAPRTTLPVPHLLETVRQTGSESAAGRTGTRRSEYDSCGVAAPDDLQRITS